MIRAVLVYPRSAGTRFDADYWLNTHMPMITSKAPGVTWEADVAVSPDQPHHAIAHLVFPDMATFASVAGSPGFADLGADVPNYTDIVPVLHLSEVKRTS